MIDKLHDMFGPDYTVSDHGGGVCWVEPNPPVFNSEGKRLMAPVVQFDEATEADLHQFVSATKSAIEDALAA